MRKPAGGSGGEGSEEDDGMGWVIEGAVLEAKRDHVLVALDLKVWC